MAYTVMELERLRSAVSPCMMMDFDVCGAGVRNSGYQKMTVTRTDGNL